MEIPTKSKRKYTPSSRRKSNIFSANDIQPKIRPSQYYIKEIDMKNILTEGQSIMIPLKTESNNLEEIKAASNKLITKYGSDEEIYCDVCLNKSFSEGDLIVICDLCEAAVHQLCYGGELIHGVPSDQWFCQRCDTILKKKINFYSIKCCFCPEIKGIMKEINGFLWSHLSCLKWIAELGKINDNKDHLEPFAYNIERHSLNCTLCNVQYGACIQCDFGLDSGCPTSFHVSCAQRQGIIPSWNSIEGANLHLEEHGYVPIFCYSHQIHYKKAIIDELHSSRKIFEQNPLNYSCICRGFYDPLKLFYTKCKALLKNQEEPKNSLKKLTRGRKKVQTLNDYEENNTENGLTNGFAETNNSKRKDNLLFEDHNLRKKTKKEHNSINKNSKMEISEEENEENKSKNSPDNKHKESEEEFKSISTKLKDYGLDEHNLRNKTKKEQSLQKIVNNDNMSEEENLLAKNEKLSDEIQKEEKPLKKSVKKVKNSTPSPLKHRKSIEKNITQPISYINHEIKPENIINKTDLKELFLSKPAASKKNQAQLGVLSSLNLLVSGSGNQNKPVKDEIILKKWLHNWVYTLDKTYRLDLMAVAKQYHTNIDELFKGYKINL